MLWLCTTQFFSTSDDVTFDETGYMFFRPEECYVLAALKVDSEREIKLYCSSVALISSFLGIGLFFRRTSQMMQSALPGIILVPKCGCRIQLASILEIERFENDILISRDNWRARMQNDMRLWDEQVSVGGCVVTPPGSLRASTVGARRLQTTNGTKKV